MVSLALLALGAGLLGTPAAMAAASARKSAAERWSPADPIGVVRASVLAERGHSEAMGMLRALGIVHVQTASGIHLYGLAAATSAVSFAVVRASSASPTLARALSVGLGAVAWGLAWALAGYRPGMLRPLVIVLLRTQSQFFGARFRLWAPLGIAILTDLVASLWQSPEFARTLSFGRFHYTAAVGGGLLGIACVSPRDRVRWRGHLAMALASWLGVALCEAFAGEPIALLTPIWSLLTIPLFCTLAYPLLILDAYAHGLFGTNLVVRMVNELLLRITRVAAELPQVWIVDPAAAFAGLFGAFALLAWRPQSLQLLRVGVLTAFLFTAAGDASAPLGRPLYARRIEQLDVGQGDSAWIEGDDSSHGLLDVGSRRASDRVRWMRTLAELNTTRLSWIAFSHLDEDHVGALSALLDIVPVDCITVSHWELATHPRVAALLHGKRVRDWGEGCFPFFGLGPLRRGQHFGRNENMAGVVIPLVGGGSYIAFGDASKKDELALLARAHGAIQAAGPGPRILKISHHGSRFSSSAEFLRALRPTEAWISVGRRNTYGHPTTEVLRRLHDLGISYRRTDLDGALKPAKNGRP